MSGYIHNCARWINSTFSSISGTTLYAGLAPETACHPFVTYNIITDATTADTCKILSSYTVQFSVFDTEENLSTIYSIMSDIRSVYDNAKGTYADYTIDSCIYNNSYVVRDEENDGWMGIVEYLVYIQ